MGFTLTDTLPKSSRAEFSAPRKALNRDSLQLSGYRYYSPEMGRWLNRDPIGEHSLRRMLLQRATVQTGRILARAGLDNKTGRVFLTGSVVDYLFVENDPTGSQDAVGLSRIKPPSGWFPTLPPPAGPTLWVYWCDRAGFAPCGCTQTAGYISVKTGASGSALDLILYLNGRVVAACGYGQAFENRVPGRDLSCELSYAGRQTAGSQPAVHG